MGGGIKEMSYNELHHRLQEAQNYTKELKKALIHCEEALLANLPHGCDGDEETGQHYEDCLNCLVHGALAHIQEVLK